MRIYFAHSHSHKEDISELYKELKIRCKEIGIELFSFVFEVPPQPDDFALMNKAFSEIDRSNMLMVDLSNSSVGVGIEAGYAHAQKIPILYIVKKGGAISQTMHGTANYTVTYESISDIVSWLELHKLL